MFKNSDLSAEGQEALMHLPALPVRVKARVSWIDVDGSERVELVQATLNIPSHAVPITLFPKEFADLVTPAGARSVSVQVDSDWELGGRISERVGAVKSEELIERDERGDIKRIVVREIVPWLEFGAPKDG